MADPIVINFIDKPYADAAYLTKVVTPAVTANATLAVQRHTPVNASGGAITMTLPTGANSGAELSVEKSDSSTNIVTITGSIRGTAGATVTLPWQFETLGFKADSTGSWWPQFGHKTKSALDAAYAVKPLGTAAAGKYVDGGTNTWTTLPTGGSGGTVTGSPNVVNVKDSPYGAKGDNSTNDATAIQAAINAVAARGNNNSGIVYFPPGTYLTASKLTVPKNIKLVGEGAGTSILLFTGTTDATGYFITFGASGTINTNGGVERMQIDANLKLGWALLMYGPQEGSVLDLSLIRGGTVGGLDCRSSGIEGGNNKFLISSCWIWANGTTALYGAKFDDANGPFAIRDTTLVRTGGGTAAAGSAGLYFNGGYQSLSNVNCEQWESHTNLDAWSNYRADTLSSYGCTYGITRRVTSGADSAVRIVVENLTFDSATAYIRDLQQGITITSCKRWSNREIDSSAWNGAHLTMGAQHLWVDGTSVLRMKSTAPTSDTDGTAIAGSGGSTADATTTSKGVVQLAGDLTGTAASPALTTSGVTAGSYGGASAVPVLTIDAKGRVTAASTAAVSGSGSAAAAAVLSTTLGDDTNTVRLSVAATTFTQVPMTTVNVDSVSGYNTSTNYYTIPTTGTYAVFGKIRLTSGGATSSNVGVGIGNVMDDSSGKMTWTNFPSTTSRSVYTHSKIEQYTAGTQIRMYTYTDGAVQVIMAWFQVVRLDGTSALQNPFTATGDLLYASGTTPTRLAGPTTATKQILTSTGTGSAAQAPAWGTVAVADVSGAAPLASPTFTGTPAAPTATAGTSTTQIATTAFVATSYAPLASPALTGTPTAPTPALNTSTTQIATAAMVTSAMNAAQAALVGLNALTASYTLQASDGGRLLTYTSTSAGTFSLPTNATVAWGLGTVINFANLSTGALTIAGVSGVTVNSPAGFRITTQYAQASAIKIATDTWLLSGQTVV